MEIIRFDDMESLSARAAEMVSSIAADAVSKRGAFTFALAGGSTPVRTYETLAEAKGFAWDKAHIFFGDERCVGQDHEHSNFKMAEKALLSKISTPKEQIYRMPESDHEAPAHEAELRAAFEAHSLAESGKYPFDCILLGMGDDGHTASLFPGSKALDAGTELVMPVEEGLGNPPVARTTMTLPLINMARNVVFMISGTKKNFILESIAANAEEAAKLYPAARVRPAGNLIWLASA